MIERLSILLLVISSLANGEVSIISLTQKLNSNSYTPQIKYKNDANEESNVFWGRFIGGFSFLTSEPTDSPTQAPTQTRLPSCSWVRSGESFKGDQDDNRIRKRRLSQFTVSAEVISKIKDDYVEESPLKHNKDEKNLRIKTYLSTMDFSGSNKFRTTKISPKTPKYARNYVYIIDQEGMKLVSDVGNLPSVRPSISSKPSVSRKPSKHPSASPSSKPSASKKPSKKPSIMPSKNPTILPSRIPTMSPSLSSSSDKSSPSRNPSKSPSKNPSKIPSKNPTVSSKPSSKSPSISPSRNRYCSALGTSVDSNKEGTVIVAGEPGCDYFDIVSSGRMRIYERISSNSSTWYETQIIGGKENGNFGTAVAVSDYGNGWIAGVQQGEGEKIFTFRNNNNKWQAEEKISKIGKSVALSGSSSKDLILVTGDPNISNGNGIVSMYKWKNTWKLINTILGKKNEEFGYSVALSDDGNTLVVGAPAMNVNGTGYVYVYDISNEDLASQVKMKGTNEEIGWSVAVNKNGTHIITSGNSFSDTHNGIVRVFMKKEDVWAQKGNTIKASFGDINVDISDDGNRIVLGSTSFRMNSGETVVLDYNETSNLWEEKFKVIGGKGDEAGVISLSNEGETVVIGAPGNCAGEMFVFDEDCR